MNHIIKFKNSAYGATQEAYIESNTGEAKIKGCGDETCVEGYLDANGPTLRTEVEDELAKKQAEIADKNAVRNKIEIIILIFSP